MRNRSKRASLCTAVIVATSAFWQGCAPMKTVTINSSPDKATLTIYHVSATGEEKTVPLDLSQTQTPVVLPLNFADQSHYRVEAHHVLCLPSMSTLINFDQQTSYNIDLTQYKQYVTGIVNMPTKSGEIWQLRPTPVQTVASLDGTEPYVYYISQPGSITHNKRPDVDYPAFTCSPVAPLMVYELIQPDSSTNTGYSSKLWKLTLQAGENPVLETQSRKQQRFPAFTFNGDNVVFDSNDDNRTDAPYSFKTDENESSIGRLEPIPDTLEYDFSIGKDNIAFASYGPNSVDPQICAASPDGSGSTVRAEGLEPQLSPDGSLILFIHHPEGGGKYRICTVNTRGPIQKREFPLNDDVDYFDPHWSPDGKMIVFCTPSRGTDKPDDIKKEPDPRYHDAESEHSFIWIMSADGQHNIRLTRNESFDNNPVFDRNGRTIYFRSNRGGVWNIWKMDLTDNTFTELHVAPPQQ
jgi:Tol biopolymer transport system component